LDFIDFFFYLTGILAVSIFGFKAGIKAASYVFDNWIPYVRVTISHIDKQGVKRSKAVWLDKRVPEDAELIEIINKVNSGT